MSTEFDEFVASGEVEVGESNLESQKVEKAKADNTEVAETPETEEVEFALEGEPSEDKKPKSPKESQIDRLKRERAQAQREARELKKQLEAVNSSEISRRLENLEKGLQSGNNSVKGGQGQTAPNPMDTEKYPLGHLDDRYIEDKLEWLSEQKATAQADAVLRRQQENERQQAVQQEQQILLGKVDDLATRGSDIYEDFQESVIETGMRGDWELSQVTFESAHEAENGAQILYELSQNPKEASRVAKLSPYQQMKFVQERDAEIGKSKTGRKIPQAGEPPKNAARGVNSRVQISPATDNLDDFEKAWEAEARRAKR